MSKDVLILKKRGCDFMEPHPNSDIGNYRVFADLRDCTPNHVCGNFMLLDPVWETRYINKRTGKKLKNPIKEVAFRDGITTDLQCETENGTFCYVIPGFDYNTTKRMLYTKDNILKIVNSIPSIKTKFDAVKIVD